MPSFPFLFSRKKKKRILLSEYIPRTVPELDFDILEIVVFVFHHGVWISSLGSPFVWSVGRLVGRSVGYSSILAAFFICSSFWTLSPGGEDREMEFGRKG